MGGGQQGTHGGGFDRSLTTFVGRAAEVQLLEELLGGHRLVTITGPGGVGKTRLAAETTRAQQRLFPDGIRVVELAAIRDPAQVPWAVAAALAAQDDKTQAITQAIAAVLMNEQSLLVLDNCEQVVAAVAELCQTLLSDSDDIQILATSREPIGVAGEVQLRLPPFSADPEAAASGDADGVALFLDRVRLREPRFALTPHSTRQATEVVARVDGLPLAIELAAARVESMGLTQLLQRLDQPLRILTSGARTTVPRHRSLRATADWSYQLLSEEAQRVFRRVAILPGPFTLDTAIAVAGDGVDATIFSLVEASILLPPREGPDGRTRYLMLDSLRAYGHDQLVSSDELDAASSALTAYALILAEQAATLMQTAGGEASAASWIDAESALLHHALLWGLDHDHAQALRLALALAPWWRLRGLRSMGYPMLFRAADQLCSRHEPGWHSGEKWLGVLALGNSAWQLAARHFTTLLDAVERGPLSTECVDARVGRSAALRNLGQLQAATEDAFRGWELARTLVYGEGVALALTQLMLAASHADDSHSAMRWHAELREMDTTRVPDEVARQIAVAETVLLADAGDLPGARQACAQGLASARAAGDVAAEADFLHLITRIALLSEDVADAGSHIGESLRVIAKSGYRLRTLDCLDVCAQLCTATNRCADAITLWAARSAQKAAHAMAERPHDVRRRQLLLGQAHQRLGPAAVLHAERRGSGMTFHTAAEFAAILAASAAAPVEQSPTGVRLTAREKELIILVARGHTDAQIAEMLFISVRTVHSHLDRIRDKSGCRRRADLTRLALQHGLA